jgi:hypothetical protein
MQNHPGKLLVEHEFKEPGKPELHKYKPGKKVTVDRHKLDYGWYVVWATKTRYALVAGEKLHEIVELDK